MVTRQAAAGAGERDRIEGLERAGLGDAGYRFGFGSK